MRCCIVGSSLRGRRAAAKGLATPLNRLLSVPRHIGPSSLRSAGIAIGFVGAVSCLNPCGNEQVETIPSPTHKWSAVVFIRDCGATTGFSTQISILRTGDVLPNEGGNVLVLGDRSGRVTTDKMRIAWRSDSHLELKVPLGSDVRFFSRSHRDIAVELVEYEDR